MAESVSGHSAYADSTIPLKARLAQTQSQEETPPMPPVTPEEITPKKISPRPTYMTNTTGFTNESRSHESFLLQSMNATKDAMDLDGYFVCTSPVLHCQSSLWTCE